MQIVIRAGPFRDNHAFHPALIVDKALGLLLQFVGILAESIVEMVLLILDDPDEIPAVDRAVVEKVVPCQCFCKDRLIDSCY